jgi:hypothetical protein
MPAPSLNCGRQCVACSNGLMDVLHTCIAEICPHHSLMHHGQVWTTAASSSFICASFICIQSQDCISPDKMLNVVHAAAQANRTSWHPCGQ